MKQATVVLTKEKYEKLKKKAKIADSAIVQLNLSLKDLRSGRVSRF